MSLTLIDVVTYGAAGCLALSRILTVAQPLWGKLPKWLAVVVPVLVTALPQLASALGLVHTDVDLSQFAVTAVALLVPGITAAERASTATPAITVTNVTPTVAVVTTTTTPPADATK